MEHRLSTSGKRDDDAHERRFCALPERVARRRCYDACRRSQRVADYRRRAAVVASRLHAAAQAAQLCHVYDRPRRGYDRRLRLRRVSFSRVSCACARASCATRATFSDVHTMHGHLEPRIAFFCWLCVTLVAPFLLLVGAVYYFGFNESVRGGDYVAPLWLAHWVSALFVISCG